MVGSAGNAPVRRFRLRFVTPDLQSGSRITSLEIGLPSIAWNPNDEVPLRRAYGGHRSLGALALLRFQAKDGSGSGSHTHLKKFMRLLSVHWSSFPQLKLVESVGNAPT